MCPGVGIDLGAPGSPAATSSVSGWAVGMPARVRAPLRMIATDHLRNFGCQARAATSDGDACSRYSRLEWPTSSAWQKTGVPCVFGEPDGRAEVVDVGVGQQDCAHVVDAESELAQRVQHVGAVAGEAGVDEHDAALSSATRVQLTRSVWAKWTRSVMAVRAGAIRRV